MTTTVRFHASPSAFAELDSLVVIGRQGRLLAEDVRRILPALPPGVWDDMVRRGDPGDNGRSTLTWTGTIPRKLAVGVLPESCSRHNTPSRAWAIPALAKAAGASSRLGLVLAVDDPAHAFASALAAVRAFPSYHGGSRNSENTVDIAILANGPVDLDRVRIGADAVRFAARLADVPPNQLTTTSLVETARELAGRLPGVRATVIQGDALLREGFGGIWNVGKASAHPPAFVVLDRDAPGPRQVWIGKGITFDTGGLSLKTKTSMPGMKTDMAGAAAVLAAFTAAVQLDAPFALTAILCVAENSVGSNAMRPDDVITLLSGKTVEVNNTDAEGRLVLADGLAWAVRNRSPARIVDVATLTGAQRVATGKRHAAIVCSDEEFEQEALRAGRASGDLVHALPFVPEFLRGEFSSPVADLRNSVKDRENAQSSCAAQFLHENLGGFAGPWLHVDMAGPAVGSSGRATGFGVGLLLTLVGVGA